MSHQQFWLTSHIKLVYAFHFPRQVRSYWNFGMMILRVESVRGWWNGWLVTGTICARAAQPWSTSASAVAPPLWSAGAASRAASATKRSIQQPPPPVVVLSANVCVWPQRTTQPPGALLQIGQHATPIYRQICMAKWIYASGPLRDCAPMRVQYTGLNINYIVRIQNTAGWIRK